jgi:hypothetical protein
MPHEMISAAGEILAVLVTRETEFHETTFVSDPAAPLQLGFIAYSAGKTLPRHVHVPVTRSLGITCEFVSVRKGSCAIDIFDDAKHLIATRELREGDAVLLLAGGHGFHMHEDTVLTEVKQGPYFGEGEKELF